MLLSGVEPKTFRLITCSDALPLSLKRLVGAKAIKQGSCDKHTARIGMSMCGMCAMEINVMEYFKPSG